MALTHSQEDEEDTLVEGSDMYQQRIPSFQGQAAHGICEHFSICMRLIMKYLVSKWILTLSSQRLEGRTA